MFLFHPQLNGGTLARPPDTMHEQLSDSDAFEIVTTEFYRAPEGGLAASATRHLLQLLASIPDANLGSLTSVLYLFARMMQVFPDVRTACAPILRGYGGPHAVFTVRIVEVADDPSFPNAIQLPITGPQALDLLWAEFFVTGAREPILKIVSTLDRPDGVRHRLAAWLQERSFFGGSKRRSTASLLASAGIDLDLESRAIRTDGDLDCLCFSIAERKYPIFKELPFALSEAELLSLGIKGSALWSLRLNSGPHPLVAEICRAEATQLGGAARLRLVEPAAVGRPFRL